MGYISEITARALKECVKRGLTKAEAASELGLTFERLTAICAARGIHGWHRKTDQRGVLNPNWQGGMSRATIARTTKRVLQQAGRNLFVCERCAAHREVELPRHHKDRNRANNKIENLEVLCVPCHNKEHMSEQRRDPLGKFS